MSQLECSRVVFCLDYQLIRLDEAKKTEERRSTVRYSDSILILRVGIKAGLKITRGANNIFMTENFHWFDFNSIFISLFLPNDKDVITQLFVVKEITCS